MPQKIDVVLEEITGSLNSNQLVIPLVSGVKVKDIQSIIGDDKPIVRAMPNTAIAIRESMTCIATSKNWESRISEVQDIFELVVKQW